MRAQKLSAPQRRLLKLVAKAEPRAFTLTAGEARPALELEQLGLVRLEKTYGGRHQGAAITEEGLRALS